MPVLVILGIIVFFIAVAIFRVNKKQSDEFIRLAQEAKEAKEADDAVDADEVKDVDDTDEENTKE